MNLEKKVIFLNYRREDVGEIAGRLYTELERGFGSSYVFCDADILAPGGEWRTIEDYLARTAVLLPLIGPHWLRARDSFWRRRLDRRRDTLRAEIRYALQQRLKVLPVLLEGTPMPSAGTLPKDIRALSTLPAFALRSEEDIPRLLALVKELGTLIGAEPPRSSKRARSGRWGALLGDKGAEVGTAEPSRSPKRERSERWDMLDNEVTSRRRDLLYDQSTPHPTASTDSGGEPSMLEMERRISAWISGRPEGFKEPLEIGEVYTLNFKVGQPVPDQPHQRSRGRDPRRGCAARRSSHRMGGNLHHRGIGGGHPRYLLRGHAGGKSHGLDRPLSPSYP